MTPFQLLAEHPALDLVNTLDDRFSDHGPTESLGDYARLLAFTRQSGLLDAPGADALEGRARSSAAASALSAAHELREALATVLYGSLEERGAYRAELQVLERQFLDADRHRHLIWQPRSEPENFARGAWTWGRFAKDPALPVWLLAQSASHLLTSETMRHVRMCNSATCRWLFLDSSKNHSRRWCDMKVCGNRMKARRFHARRETE